jgi:hypothetical protein
VPVWRKVRGRMPKKKNESLDSSSVSDDLITAGRNSGQFKSTYHVDQVRNTDSCTCCFYDVRGSVSRVTSCTLV